VSCIRSTEIIVPHKFLLEKILALDAVHQKHV